MKTVLITGASSGIGRATAKFFQKEGWHATKYGVENFSESLQYELEPL